eukprot:418601-Pelagomonas_calceolata.AAC.12
MPAPSPSLLHSFRGTFPCDGRSGMSYALAALDSDVPATTEPQTHARACSAAHAQIAMKDMMPEKMMKEMKQPHR